jgi:hypothetical protein
MAVPSASRKTEAVAVQHVMEESKKPLTPDRMKIRHVGQKIVIPGTPYIESLTAQISEVSWSRSVRVVSGQFQWCGIRPGNRTSSTAVRNQLYRAFPKKPYRQHGKIASIFLALKRKLRARQDAA